MQWHRRYHRFIWLLIPVLLSCEVESDDASSEPDRIFIANRGQSHPTDTTRFKPSDISVYSFSGDSTVPDAFARANNKQGLPMGLQALALNENTLFASNQRLGYVHVIDIRTMKELLRISLGKQSGAGEMTVGSDGFLYVSGFYSGLLYKISMTTFQQVASLPVGSGPMQSLQIGDELFLAVSGFGTGQEVLVINMKSFSVTDTLYTQVNPTRLARTGQQLVVLASGSENQTDMQPAVMYLFNPSTREKADSLVFSSKTLMPYLSVDDGGRIVLWEGGTRLLEVVNSRFGSSGCYSVHGGHPIAIGMNIFTIADAGTNQFKRLRNGEMVGVWALGIYPTGSAVVSYR